MIGVFDSGIGGLSVLNAVAAALPGTRLVYLADNRHLPYGNKSEAFIRERVLAIGAYLAANGCDLVIVACNTATAAAIEALRQALPQVFIVGVEPGVKPAASRSSSKRIAVLATESTAKSTRLRNLVTRFGNGCTVEIVACPGWATRVEALDFGDAGFGREIEETLAPVLDRGADQVVLGCTHYAFIKPLLEPLCAGRAEIVDVADAVARQVVRQAAGLACVTAAGNGQSGEIQLLATAFPERLVSAFGRLCRPALPHSALDGARQVAV